MEIPQLTSETQETKKNKDIIRKLTKTCFNIKTEEQLKILKISNIKEKLTKHARTLVLVNLIVVTVGVFENKLFDMFGMSCGAFWTKN